MFIPNDKTIEKELIIEQLIKETSESTSYMWCRKNYNDYSEYMYTVKINETINLVFRIYHYKTHDNHLLNIYLSKRRGVVYTSVLSINSNPKILELVKVIEKDKFYKE